MEEEFKSTEKRLKTLEGYLGFLGVILAISMAIAWDYITNWSSGQFKYREVIKSAAILYYIYCVFILILVIGFYLARYEEKDDLAEKIASRLLNMFIFAILLAIIPTTDILISRNPQADFVAGLIDIFSIITVLVMTIVLVISIFSKKVDFLGILDKIL